jgi:hypothetical protein
MRLTRKVTLAVALAAPLLFLAPPNAEAQSVRLRSSGQVYGQRYSAGARYYGPRTQYRYRSGSPRYYSRGYYQPYRGSYGRYSGRYYAPPRVYGGASVRLRF